MNATETRTVTRCQTASFFLWKRDDGVWVRTHTDRSSLWQRAGIPWLKVEHSLIKFKCQTNQTCFTFHGNSETVHAWLRNYLNPLDKCFSIVQTNDGWVATSEF